MLKCNFNRLLTITAKGLNISVPIFRTSKFRTRTLHYSVLVGSRNEFKRDYTTERNLIEGLMGDRQLCQMSSLVQYRQYQSKSSSSRQIILKHIQAKK